MKKIFFFIIISSTLFAQQNKSIIELQLSGKSLRESKVENGNQNEEFRIQNSTITTFTPALVPQANKKNPGLAILYSMLLPGMGELYANRYDSGIYFTIADGAIWGVFAGFNIYGNWKENNYRSFAEINGKVNLVGKDADFFANISGYVSIDDYNRDQELNREFSKVYNTSTHYWNWQTNDKRKEYRELWSSSEGAFNNVRFAVGALVLNRLISAINAVRLVSAYNKNLEQDLSWNVYFNYEDKVTLPPNLTLNFTTTF